MSKFRTVGSLSGGKSPLRMHGLEDILDVADKAKAVNVSVENLRNHFIKWFGEEDGGLFSYKVAVELAAYIKSKLLENKDIPATNYPLSLFWRDVKEKYHKDSANKLGVASGTLADSIKARKWSGKSGRWMVTVEGTYSAIPGYKGGGKIRDVGVVGSLLEFGMEGFSGSGESLHQSSEKDPKKPVSKFLQRNAPVQKKEKHVQPPRPWFYPAFVQYTDEKFPELADRIFINKFNQYYKRLAKDTSAMGDDQLNKFIPVELKDMYWIEESSDFDPEDYMSEVEIDIQESGMRGIRGESVSSMMGKEAGESPSYESAYDDFDPGADFIQTENFLTIASTGEFYQMETQSQVRDFIYQLSEALKKGEDIEGVKGKWSKYKM